MERSCVVGLLCKSVTLRHNTNREHDTVYVGYGLVRHRDDDDDEDGNNHDEGHREEHDEGPCQGKIGTPGTIEDLTYQSRAKLHINLSYAVHLMYLVNTIPQPILALPCDCPPWLRLDISPPQQDPITCTGSLVVSTDDKLDHETLRQVWTQHTVSSLSLFLCPLCQGL